MAKVQLDAAAFRAKLASAVVPAMDKGALGLVGQLRVDVGKSARVSAVGARGGPKGGRSAAAYAYEASKPGEPPRKRTGTLQKSIAREVAVEDGGRSVVARVGTNVPYARPLEFGTRKMAARPFLRPALAAYLRTFERIVAADLKRRFGILFGRGGGR